MANAQALFPTHLLECGQLGKVRAIKLVDDDVVRVGGHGNLCTTWRNGEMGEQTGEAPFSSSTQSCSVYMLFPYDSRVRSLFHAWQVTGMTGLVTT